MPIYFIETLRKILRYIQTLKYLVELWHSYKILKTSKHLKTPHIEYKIKYFRKRDHILTLSLPW